MKSKPIPTGKKKMRKICEGENTGVAEDCLIRFTWISYPKVGQVLFIKTMREISQLYKGLLSKTMR